MQPTESAMQLLSIANDLASDKGALLSVINHQNATSEVLGAALKHKSMDLECLEAAIHKEQFGSVVGNVLSDMAKNPLSTPDILRAIINHKNCTGVIVTLVSIHSNVDESVSALVMDWRTNKDPVVIGNRLVKNYPNGALLIPAFNKAIAESTNEENRTILKITTMRAFYSGK